MKLLVLGGTGPTGRIVVDAALAAGDDVTVLARTPASGVSGAPNLTVIEGDATSADDVAGAAADQDAIVSALGRATSLEADELFSLAAEHVVAAAEEAGVRRLVWLSSFGVGDTLASASPEQAAMYTSFLRDIYADKAKAEETIRSSGLDWTIVYPTNLTDDPAGEAVQVDDRIPMSGVPSISRASVAAFMHAAVTDTSWVGRDAVITD